MAYVERASRRVLDFEPHFLESCENVITLLLEMTLQGKAILFDTAKFE
jgi:hypothetical protein